MDVKDAFVKFRHLLEITKSEEDDASLRHQEIRDHLRTKLDVDDDFLTGSYRRDTKTKPLADVDVFIVLGDVDEQDEPNDVLKRVHDALVEKYGEGRVATDRPAVRVDFGPENADADAEDKVMSVEVVPAFVHQSHYRIADPAKSGWMSTDPKVHATLATDANKAYAGEWKPLVKMIKAWNRHQGEPVVPSFLIEVMALKLFHNGWVGPYAYEVRAFFAAAAERIDETWVDPAGLGSPVSDQLHLDTLALEAARVALRDAERQSGEAIRLEKSSGSGAANDAWQRLFGPRYAKS